MEILPAVDLMGEKVVRLLGGDPATKKTYEHPVQVGGGIRSLDTAHDYLEMGVGRIVLGSLAFANPSRVRAILDSHGSGRVVVAVDNIKGKVAVRGWRATTESTVEESISMFSSIGIHIFLVTAVARDGTLMGPDLDLMNRAIRLGNVHIIAAGGISSLEDLVRLDNMGVYGVVIGKALYEGKIRLADAFNILRK
jgi:phosphoribosylformimino-5-aminoimidazole carboxamide ribotide isomerase